jgi:hypothetical protein
VSSALNLILGKAVRGARRPAKHWIIRRPKVGGATGGGHIALSRAEAARAEATRAEATRTEAAAVATVATSRATRRPATASARGQAGGQVAALSATTPGGAAASAASDELVLHRLDVKTASNVTARSKRGAREGGSPRAAGGSGGGGAATIPSPRSGMAGGGAAVGATTAGTKQRAITPRSPRSQKASSGTGKVQSQMQSSTRQ